LSQPVSGFQVASVHSMAEFWPMTLFYERAGISAAALWDKRDICPENHLYFPLRLVILVSISQSSFQLPTGVRGRRRRETSPRGSIAMNPKTRREFLKDVGAALVPATSRSNPPP